MTEEEDDGVVASPESSMIARRRSLISGSSLLSLAPGLASAGEDVVQGSGLAATQRREVGAFTAVALGAPFSVVLRQGSREGVEIVADGNLMPFIETKISGRGERTLTIGVARDARIDPRTPVVVTIDFVRLDGIALGSSGRITGQGLRLDALSAAIGGSGAILLPALDVATMLDVSIGGSGKVVADGRASKLSVTVAGSGRCDLENLVAGDVSVAIAGSGTARVHALTSLSATIAGSGEILYLGDVSPSSTIIGNGRLKRL